MIAARGMELSNVPRKAFNTFCDIYKGPGTNTPGLFVGTFACRYVVEDGIHAIGPGCPAIPAYITLQGYQPQGAWTSPFFGMDASLCDRIAIPSGNPLRFWVLYTDVIIWGGQAQYYRAYVVYLPAPTPGPAGGILWNGSAIVTFEPVVSGSGGILWNGSAIVTFEPVVSGSGGILWNGSALASMTRMRLFEGSGGILWNGSGTVTFTPGSTIIWKDTFTGTTGAGVPPHVGELTPGGYTNDTGGMEIDGNELTNSSTFSVITYDPSATTWHYTCNFRVDANTSGIAFLFRYQDDFTNFYVQMTWGGPICTSYTLGNTVGGGTLATGTVSLAINSTYNIQIDVTPTTISVTVDGVTVSVSNSSLSTKTLHAFRVNASTVKSAHFDLLEITA